MARLRIYVEAVGEGPAVVLAHGFAGSARNWRPQQRALRVRHHVVTFDARGHARSEAPESLEDYGQAVLAEDLDAVVQQAGDPRPVVGGLSMGAAVVLAWALAHPGCARGLVLSSYPAGPASGRGISARALAFADAIEREGVEVAGSRFAWGPDSGLDARGAALVRQGFLEHPVHGLVHTLRGFLARLPSLASLRPALARLDLPVLVVAGARDAASLPTSRQLAAVLPQAQLVEIPEAGHVVNLTAPAAYNRHLLAFLGGLGQARTP